MDPGEQSPAFPRTARAAAPERAESPQRRETAMQTWLDWYVSGSSLSYRRACERFPGIMPGTDLETHRRAMTDDAFAFRCLLPEEVEQLMQAPSPRGVDFSPYLP